MELTPLTFSCLIPAIEPRYISMLSNCCIPGALGCPVQHATGVEVNTHREKERERETMIFIAKLFFKVVMFVFYVSHLSTESTDLFDVQMSELETEYLQFGSLKTLLCVL